MEIKQISSLQRVFLDGNCDFEEIKSARALKGERFSYQIAYKSNSRCFAKITVDSDLAEYISIREVGNVPSELPCYDGNTEFYERTEAGLFPDVLYPIEDLNHFLIKQRSYYSLWVTVDLPAEAAAGDHLIKITISDGEELEASAEMSLSVINAVLLEQKLIYTQWFHSDCIANYYNVPVFSEAFWRLAESFMRTAVKTGVNMILTPILTPPLDTAIGGERLTVQLVDVDFTDGKYSFGFDKFRRWVKLAQECGFKYFEMSHLFSQWGAFAAPKVTATVDGEYRKLFGWDTPSDSAEYTAFLRSLIPELIVVLGEEGIADKTYFHISDEPSSEQLDSYSRAKATVSDLLKDFPVIDALSEYEFYKNGLVERPIPSTSSVHTFLENGYERHWTYYCCGQGEDLSNRFFAMPLAATRILGTQLYKYDMEGFLQWGYNFYNSCHSVRAINPFYVTDADGAFASGDSYTVYPYRDGAIESVRAVVFYEGLQDMRAMELLGGIIGKDRLIEKLETELGEITFRKFPRGTKNMLALRDLINTELKKLF